MSKYNFFSGPYFPVFRLNTGKYGLEKTPYLDTFHTVSDLPICLMLQIIDKCFSGSNLVSTEAVYSWYSWYLQKPEALAQVFSCKFCEIFKNTFSYRTPPVATSDGTNLTLFSPIFHFFTP